MPELPEVETITRDLKEKLIGHTITDFFTYWPKMLGGMTENSFKKEILNEKIIGVERRAKNIIIQLSNNKNMLFHMKMTGHLIYTTNNHEVNKEGKWVEPEKTNFSDPYNQCIRLIFYLDKGKILAFSDLRKFGYVKIFNEDDLNKEFKKYGPEPFSKDFNSEYLIKAFKNRNVAIKKVLMDQRIIAGIGNIYADEILWDAEIHPEKKVCYLKESEIENIIKSTKKILQKAIKMRGTSTSDFRDTSGEKGAFGKFLKAYQRTGQKCERDDGVIERIVVGGRGTHYCPVHQILEGL